MKESQYRLYTNYCRNVSRTWKFLEGLPFKYYPGPVLLNFSVRMGIGVSNMLTPMAIHNSFCCKNTNIIEKTLFIGILVSFKNYFICFGTH
jgi:hypothetical protein